MARFDVTDSERALIEPFLPVAATRPLPGQERSLFNGVFWHFRNGTGWRDVPERYEVWSTVYGRFRASALAGVFEALMDALSNDRRASVGQALHGELLGGFAYAALETATERLDCEFLPGYYHDGIQTRAPHTGGIVRNVSLRRVAALDVRTARSGHSGQG